MSSCSQSLSSGMFKAHRQEDSGELDVFEAALYFSGEVNEVGLGLQRAWRAERRSLDTPMEATLFQQPRRIENQLKDKKHKQPSSPGGKLAKFLRSFFHQTVSKKKSKSVAPTQSFKDGECYVGKLERRRRNSINHPESMRSRDTKSISSSHIWRTGLGIPLPYTDHPSEEPQKPVPFCSRREVWHGIRVVDEVLLAERAKSISNYVPRAEVFMQKEDKWCRRREEEEDGGGSDSSSDLFELKNYDLRVNSSNGLPVYGTTDPQAISGGTGDATAI